jgi:hypothetical protein
MNQRVRGTIEDTVIEQNINSHVILLSSTSSYCYIKKSLVWLSSLQQEEKGMFWPQVDDAGRRRPVRFFPCKIFSLLRFLTAISTLSAEEYTCERAMKMTFDISSESKVILVMARASIAHAASRR